MKTTLVPGLFLALTAHASAALRTFTAQDGRTLKAQATEFNEPKGEVTIQREDGKRFPLNRKHFQKKTKPISRSGMRRRFS